VVAAFPTASRPASQSATFREIRPLGHDPQGDVKVSATARRLRVRRSFGEASRGLRKPRVGGVGP